MPRVANPVDPVTAEKLHEEIYYSDPHGRLTVIGHYASRRGGWQPLVARLYDPVDRLHGTQKAKGCRSTWIQQYDGSGGAPWVPECLREVVDTSGSSVLLYNTDGSVITFRDMRGGVFSAGIESKARLRLKEDTWLLEEPDGSVSTFEADGSLSQRTRADGAQVRYGYTAGLLTQISDHTGRVVTLDVDARQRLRSLTAPGEARLTVTRTPETNPRTEVIAYPGGSSKTLHYDEAELVSGNGAGRLTGIVDERDVRYANYRYVEDRVREEFRAGAVGNYEFVRVGSTTSITDPLNSVRKLTFTNDVAGNPRLLSQSQPAGSGCSASTSRMVYDAQSQLVSRDDFDGHRTCYGRDARRLEIARIEGLASTAQCSSYTPVNAPLPAGSRKISTQWHPDVLLPTRIAEPGVISTRVYNGQPDPFNGNAPAACAPPTALLPNGKPILVLCKLVQQSTTDTDGSKGFSATLDTAAPPRSWTTTYNQFGQVMTHRGPLRDVDDTTTYAYYEDTTADHTWGDLMSVKPALLPATQFTKYNARGQLLEMVDANQVASTFVYDDRHRLNHVTVAEQAHTHYDWWPTGLLRQVTLPDGSWVSYGYDDAHRLTDITDDRGNNIHYELDNQGNRRHKTITDPAGILRRQIDRAIDALGRVQQTTGGQ